MLNRNNKRKGFTLLEILLVVAAIGILAGIVILALNPGKQLADTRNSQRSVDVNTILNAVYQYSLDNDGSIPAAIGITTTATPAPICSSAGGADCTGLSDLGVLTTNGEYLVSIPNDPSAATADSTGYTIIQDANGRVTVSAPSAEEGATISVTR